MRKIQIETLDYYLKLEDEHCQKVMERLNEVVEQEFLGEEIKITKLKDFPIILFSARISSDTATTKTSCNNDHPPQQKEEKDETSSPQRKEEETMHQNHQSQEISQQHNQQQEVLETEIEIEMEVDVPEDFFPFAIIRVGFEFNRSVKAQIIDCVFNLSQKIKYANPAFLCLEWNLGCRRELSSVEYYGINFNKKKYTICDLHRDRNKEDYSDILNRVLCSMLKSGKFVSEMNNSFEKWERWGKHILVSPSFAKEDINKQQNQVEDKSKWTEKERYVHKYFSSKTIVPSQSISRDYQYYSQFLKLEPHQKLEVYEFVSSYIRKKTVLVRYTLKEGDHEPRTVGHLLSIGKQLQEINKKGLVFADVRLSNMIFDEKDFNEASLIDFDMMGKHREKCYHDLFNENIGDGKRAPTASGQSLINYQDDWYSLWFIASQFECVDDQQEWNKIINLFNEDFFPDYDIKDEELFKVVKEFVERMEPLKERKLKLREGSKLKIPKTNDLVEYFEQKNYGKQDKVEDCSY